VLAVACPAARFELLPLIAGSRRVAAAPLQVRLSGRRWPLEVARAPECAVLARQESDVCNDTRGCHQGRLGDERKRGYTVFRTSGIVRTSIRRIGLSQEDEQDLLRRAEAATTGHIVGQHGTKGKNEYGSRRQAPDQCSDDPGGSG
jgi:hypothetical protein